MLYGAMILFVLAIVMALLGYGAAPNETAPLLKIAFLGFFILALLGFVVQAARRT